MGRRAKYTFSLPDGRTVGANFKVRGNYFRSQFPHPTEQGHYVEVSTGVAVPKKFDPTRDPPADWFAATARLILQHHTPTLRTDPKTATWDNILAELKTDSELRPRSFEVYSSMLGIFRRYVPLSAGPDDVTAEIAKAFRKKYAEDGFKRSEKPDAKTYRRSPKTVENAIRRLSGLWGKLIPKFARENPWDHVSRPTVPKNVPVIPTEDDVAGFFKWLSARYPGWELPSVFVEVKALSACRLSDLCHVRTEQFDPVAATLTINADLDKTHRQRIIPLPDDLVAALNRLKGKEFLWSRYLEDSRIHRPGSKNKGRELFAPSLLYNAMKNIFREYGSTGGKLRSHGLRKRAITLTALATQNVDQTAEAIGIDPATARKYYLDAKAAFNGAEVMKKMAGVLRPQAAPYSA